MHIIDRKKIGNLTQKLEIALHFNLQYGVTLPNKVTLRQAKINIKFSFGLLTDVLIKDS